ncbi:hypothetical protein SteCoe_1763 [Stentor coeruleus]|uniref:SHSP domain-containing protein n=1 Tax=Stentor coeruleus TaxID=5963 RepID=A0A1R2D0Y7_9CILI|nr:hypothetical protein SteCoe_1763 [Stentor coeruleus]
MVEILTKELEKLKADNLSLKKTETLLAYSQNKELKLQEQIALMTKETEELKLLSKAKDKKIEELTFQSAYINNLLNETNELVQKSTEKEKNLYVEIHNWSEYSSNLKNQVEELTEENSHLKSTIQILETEFQVYKQNFITSKDNEINQKILSDSNQKQIKEVEIYNLAINELKIQKQKLETKINQLSLQCEENYDICSSESNEGKYDCIININSFSDLATEGWELEFPCKPDNTEINSKNYYKLYGNSQAFLSVTGAYDKGKTFLLNKLCSSKFLSSKKIETKGLSFKSTRIEQTTDIIIIDTAGTHSPVKNYKQLALKKDTEKRIRDLVFLLSDFFIFVVNDYTTLDQELLDKLEKQVKGFKSKAFKEIVVVHNLKDVYNEDDCEKAWQKQILSLYDTSTEAKLNITTVDSESEVKWLKTRFSRHLVIVNDRCLYGKTINENSIKLLKMWVQTECASHKNKNLFEELFIILSKDIKNSIKIEDRDQGNNNYEMFQDADFICDNSKYYLKNSKFSKETLNVTNNQFDPDIDLVKNPNEMIVIIDTPGVDEDQLDLKVSKNELIVSGTREQDYDGVSQYTTRTFGAFTLKIKIPRDYDSRNGKKVYKDGTLRIEFPADSGPIKL